MATMPTNHTPPPAVPRHSRLQGQTAESLADYYSGKKLYGDDFSLAEIREWYSLEENACFADVYDQGRKRMPNNDFLHWHCGYRWAMNNSESLGKVLGLGSGNGEEFRPVRKLRTLMPTPRTLTCFIFGWRFSGPAGARNVLVELRGEVHRTFAGRMKIDSADAVF